MNSLEFLDANPSLRRVLLGSKLLDIIPCGLSIATDSSCKNIIHNAVTAKFLRIGPWDQLSFSAPELPSMQVYQNGKLLVAAEMPMQQAAWCGREIVGCELEFVWEDGISKTARWSASPLYDEKGIICGSIATMEEMTDVVQMTRELHKHKIHLEELVEERTSQLKFSEERFTKIFYSSPHAMSINRKVDLRYLDVNDRWLQNSNFTREKVIGKTPLELGVPEAEYQSFMKVWSEYGSVTNLESSLIKDYNVAGTMIISAESIVINGEECILFASTDITEMKRMQAEMARLDRLNLVGEMAVGIGHEIRNPMTVVRGYLQLLGVRPEFQACRPTFQTMIAELDRANSIISEFLLLARNRPTERREQNINHILRNLCPLLETDACAQNKKVVIETGEVPTLSLDAKEISQLVLNLCRNGLEAMQEQGTVTVRTYIESDKVVLCVQDEGCGIPQENIERCGIPFFTTKEYGTGLGLAACYSIAV